MSTCALDAASCVLFKALITYLLNPVMLLLAGAAAVYFLWGMVEFLNHMREGKGLDDGKRHMIYGIAGLFVIVCAYAIIQFIQNTIIQLGGGM